jgi:Flp pilus assembly protein TadD
MDRFEDSIKQMKRVLEIDPEHAEALNFIGYSYAERGIHLAEAEKLIRQALILKPDNGYILDSMGWVYFKQNRIEQAIRYLKEADKRIPDDPTIAEHLGDALRKAGRFQEALDAYRRAQKYAPENSQLRQKIEQLRR